MKVKAAIAALILPGLLAGCASSSVGLRAGASSSVQSAAPPGTSTSAVSIRAQGSPNPYFGMILVAPILFGSGNDDRRFSVWPSARKAPDMAEGRAIAERDCREPLGQIEGNLRCK